MENTVRYKQFDITVEVELESLPSNLYRVITQVQRLNETQPRRWRLTFEEFDSEKAAYEFGLQEARVWIDEHE